MSLYQSQKAVKPNVEDVAGDFVHGENLSNLMDFLAFIKENKLKPQWMSSNSWSVKYKGKNVCYIKIIGSSWYVFHSQFTREKWFVEYDHYFTDGELKAFVWDNIDGRYCPNDCRGKKKMVLGKEMNDICTCWPFRLENPNGARLELSKKLILIIKNFIADLPATSNA